MVDTAQSGPGGTGGNAQHERQAGGRRHVGLTGSETRRLLAGAAVVVLFVVGVGAVAATEGTAATSDHNTTVTVVTDNETAFGQQTATLLERGVDLAETPLDVTVVDSEAVNNSLDSFIQETDAFVFHYFADGVAEEVIPAVESDPDTHAVYIEQYDLTTTNAIFERAGVLSDPDAVQRAFDSGEANNVSFDIQADHPLFEGVGQSGDTILIHNETDSDRVFFAGATGETLAEVGIEAENNSGPVAAVDPENGSVLLGTIAPHPAQNGSAFTDQAAQILGNAVLLGVETEPPEVELSNLDIAGQGAEALVYDGPGDVSLDLTHVGGGAGEVNVTLQTGEATVTRTVQVEVNETASVVFENATSELSPGSYNVTGSVDGDTVAGSLLLSVDPTGDGEPATDTTGDGLLNDVDGDESFDIFDVQALFNNLERQPVQNSPELFNFNDDESPDGVSIFDVQGLFNQLD